MIFHVVTRNNWENAQKKGFYEADSLATEGFIHTSQKHQVKGDVGHLRKCRLNQTW